MAAPPAKKSNHAEWHPIASEMHILLELVLIPSVKFSLSAIFAVRHYL